MKKIMLGLLSAALLLSLSCPVVAAESELETAAASLEAQGIMVGDETGALNLEAGLTRSELVAILTRLHGGGEIDPAHYAWACYYSDVPEWARGYVGYCTAHLLVVGYGDQRYGAGDPVTPQMAATVILRSFGYADDEGSVWSYDTASRYAVQLGLMDQATAQNPLITRGEMGVMIHRAQQAAGETPAQPDLSRPQLEGITRASDGTIIGKVITQPAWSREDFSRQANPEIFTGVYTRSWYNAIRQSIVDRDMLLAGAATDYLYAHTLVPDTQSAAFSDVLGRLSGLYQYTNGAESYTQNQYEYPGYTVIKVDRTSLDADASDMLEQVLDPLSRQSDRDKVMALNNFVCDRLDYLDGAHAGVAKILAADTKPVYGQCGSYASAFKFLCQAADIPCITVKSADHAWNEVYVDGQWLTVDVTYNDASLERDWYLLTIGAADTDIAPDATRFARELLVPGSTKS